MDYTESWVSEAFKSDHEELINALWEVNTGECGYNSFFIHDCFALLVAILDTGFKSGKCSSGIKTSDVLQQGVFIGPIDEFRRLMDYLAVAGYIEFEERTRYCDNGNLPELRTTKPWTIYVSYCTIKNVYQNKDEFPKHWVEVAP